MLDVDSTLCGIEGVDWLAALREAEVAERVARETDRAMRGDVALEDVYGVRLDAVRPTQDEVERLSERYMATLAAGAGEFISAVHAKKVRIILVSGGIRQALLPLAERLGIPSSDVNAVDLFFAKDGSYAGYDARSPLTRATGKLEIVRRATLARPILAVGDGSTDLVMREGADAFCAFTGFATRPSVIAAADCTAASFTELAGMVGVQ